jgi:hypothetical protein
LTLVFNRCSIIDIAGCNLNSQKLTDLIDDQMKLESKQPSPTGFFLGWPNLERLLFLGIGMFWPTAIGQEPI